MEAVKKETAPGASVGADAGQSLYESFYKSITNDTPESNNPDNYYDDWQREMVRSMDPSYLRTVSMSELFDTVYHSRLPVIANLLYPGTYLFVGAPKLGKSFFMAQLAYHISTGIPLWDYPVRKGTVLYLALEDDYRRLQERLFRMFETDSAENLYFAIDAKQLGKGLDEQLQGFVERHTDTVLIIIDTLQKVRELAGDKFSYASDYDIIAKLKQFADRHNICLLLVHHTRKQQSEDRFDMISGTNGLLGAADGAYLLQKEKRTSNDATLDISGRDQQDQRLYLKRDPEKLLWLLEKAESELWKEPPDPILQAIADSLSKEHPSWAGSPTELVNRLALDIKANVLTQRLNVNAGRLRHEHNVQYENSRTHAGRIIKLTLIAEEA